MPKPVDETCNNCQFGVIKLDEVLYCQRLPPTVRVVNKTGNDITEPLLPVYDYPFPAVAPDEWCGEHRAVKAQPVAGSKPAPLPPIQVR
jgi:hypothetical protein